MELDRAFTVVNALDGVPEIAAAAVTACGRGGGGDERVELSWFPAHRLGATAAAVAIDGAAAWDPCFSRCLSTVAGGFAAAARLAQGPVQQRCELFFCGRRLALETRADGLAAWRRFSAWYRTLVEGSEQELLGRATRDRHRLALRLGREPSTVAEPPPISRALFPLTEAAAFERALTGVPVADRRGWRWLPRLSVAASVPYVLMQRDGALTDDLVVRLGRALDGYALAIELSSGGAFRWLHVDPDRPPQQGLDEGADAFIERWQSVTVILAEPPGFVTWPAGEPGFDPARW